MKRIFALLICMTIVFSICVSAATIEPAGHWAQDAINYALDKGYVKGNEAGVVSADASMTRAEFVAVLCRVLSLPGFDNNPFEDVDSDAWYNGFVSTAYRAGIVTGTSDSTFSPDALVTREEAVSMLQRGWKISRASFTKPPFNDQDEISSWALNSVRIMHESLYIKGDDYNNFNPKNNVTFGEALQIIYNKQAVVSEAVSGLAGVF